MLKEFMTAVMPEGYEDVVQMVDDGMDVFLKTTSKYGDLEVENTAAIKRVLWQNADNFPKFLFTDLKDKTEVLHVWDVVKLILKTRFEQFKGMPDPYLSLVSKDLKILANYVNRDSNHSYNSKVKTRNSVAVIPVKSRTGGLYQAFLQASMDETAWVAFMTKNNVLPSSLGSMTNSGTVTMGKAKFRAPGWKQTDEGFYSLFPAGPNIPARWQTHLLSDAMELRTPDRSCIQQDCVIEDGKLLPKDKTQRKVIVAFHAIDVDNYRLMAGEIEVLSSFAETLVYVTKTVEDNFPELSVEVGKVYHPNFKPLSLGRNALGQGVTVTDCKTVEVLSITPSGINGTVKIVVRCVKKAGNARVISHAGIKGVTKVREDLGCVTFEDGNTIFPEMLLGMNSAKAKSNTIVLAGACLAVELGYYKPSVKHGFEGLLNSLDAKEVNEAYNSLPKFTYVNEHGVEEEIFIGLAYASYTELGQTYARVKKIPFAFEAGRFLATDKCPSAGKLYEHIWANYLEEETVEATKDLYKCYLECQADSLKNVEGLPMYNIEQVNSLFTEKDLVLSKVQEFESSSKFLDEEFNPRGFYIDLSRFAGAPVIRIPSAKSLKLFSGVMPNGKIIYHTTVICVSRIIRACLRGPKGSYRLNTLYSKDKGRHTSALAHNLYVSVLSSTVFSGDDAAQHMVQSFIKPKIPGCNLKQVGEAYLPPSTVVISDRKVYNKLVSHSLEGRETPVSVEELRMLLADGSDAKEAFKLMVDMAPYGIAVRNPALWRSQFCKVKVWDADMFDMYLRIYHGITVSDVISLNHNRDVVLTSIDILRDSQGDSDGDLLPIFMLDHKGQEILKSVNLQSITKAEKQWNLAYLKGELSSNEDFCVKPYASASVSRSGAYQLHFVSHQEYSKRLMTAACAKDAVGPSTIDAWVWSMILEVYTSQMANGKKTHKGSNMAKLSEEDVQFMSFIYMQLLQEMNIRGIKHHSSSKAFAMFGLSEMGKQANEAKIRSTLKSVCKASDEIINKVLYVVRYAEDDNDLIKACRNFVTLYNKGKFPVDPEALEHWEESIVNWTYFGSLVRPLAEIKRERMSNKAEDDEAFKLLLEEL